jgi:uncharacterized protein (UPF0276 family)
MKLALNYSPQAAELISTGAITVDLYKCYESPEVIAAASEQLPVYVHFPFMAGRNNLEAVGVERIRELLNETQTRYVNTHLAPRAADFGADRETRDPVHAEAMFAAMIQDIKTMTNHFGVERIILENAMWDEEWDIPRPVIQPEMISRVVKTSGCGLLLDLAHATACAHYLDIDIRDYITRLPLEQLRELHITGVGYDKTKNRLSDHYPMTGADWALAEWTLDCIHRGLWREPHIVALEYGGVGGGFEERSNIDVIAKEVTYLRALVQGLKV